jgi:hypothetical protein
MKELTALKFDFHHGLPLIGIDASSPQHKQVIEWLD